MIEDFLAPVSLRGMEKRTEVVHEEEERLFTP
jgi:hypothetical protein